MKAYEVIKTITLTVEPGSRVIVSDSQHEHVKDYIKLEDDGSPDGEGQASDDGSSDIEGQATRKRRVV